jgi:hypothetical protein
MVCLSKQGGIPTGEGCALKGPVRINGACPGFFLIIDTDPCGALLPDFDEFFACFGKFSPDWIANKFPYTDGIKVFSP